MLALLLILLAQVVAVIFTGLSFLTGINHAPLYDIFLIRLLNIRFFEHKDSNQLDPNTKILLINHRSFADFFIDSYVHSPASHLSRWMVALVIPITALYGYLTHRVLFFNRGQTKRSDLALVISRHLEKTRCPLIIYPEGHRNLEPTSLPLKRGGIKNCYEYKWPVQLTIIFGKENVLSEKSLSLHRGASCYIIRSKLLDPSLFENEEVFYNTIVQSWTDLWAQAYQNRDQKDFRAFEAPKVVLQNIRDYSRFFWVAGGGLGLFLLIMISWAKA